MIALGQGQLRDVFFEHICSKQELSMQLAYNVQESTSEIVASIAHRQILGKKEQNFKKSISDWFHVQES